jgi:hypothetical protein
MNEGIDVILPIDAARFEPNGGTAPNDAGILCNSSHLLCAIPLNLNIQDFPVHLTFRKGGSL